MPSPQRRLTHPSDDECLVLYSLMSRLLQRAKTATDKVLPPGQVLYSAGPLSCEDLTVLTYCMEKLMGEEEHTEVRIWALLSLSDKLEEDFRTLGIVALIDKAINCRSQAIRLTPDNHADKAERLHELGMSYKSRFEHTGGVSDVNKAIDYLNEAAMLCLDGCKEKADWLDDLGGSYRSRFERLGKLADVHKAIDYHTQAVQLTPSGDAERPARLDSLGNSYMRRFEGLGQLPDIDKAIAYQREAVQLAAVDHVGRFNLLNSLGTSYHCRFWHAGELEDLDEAIACQKEAVLLAPDGHKQKPGMLNNLGNSYMGRFGRLGELPDLNQALACQARAVLFIPDGHAGKPNALNNLGLSYRYRFERFGGISDINQSISYLTKAVSLTPDGHADKPGLLSNLGASHMSRFKCLDELSDLDQGISCLRQAVQLIPDGHSDRPAMIDNLGSSYLVRFIRLRDLPDLDKAVECHTQAVNLTPNGHMREPDCLYNLGQAHLYRFVHHDDVSDSKAANASFQQAALVPTIQPTVQFRCARMWATSSYMLHTSPRQGYEKAMELLPQMIWLGNTINQRYQLTVEIGDIVMEAACWAVADQSYDLAVQWLEEGRSIVWSQVLQLRTSFETISAVDPILAGHLRDVASQLEYAGSRPGGIASFATTSLDMDKDAQMHHSLANRWKQLIEQARNIPGFQNFMRPRIANDLKLAARDGPVVLINTHSASCDALLILPGDENIAHVPLKNFSLAKADDSRAQLQSIIGHRGGRAGGFTLSKLTKKPENNFRPLLASLWSDVVEPVLDYLGYTRKIPGNQLPHVTWCATGALSFLPLHAAGLYDGSQPNTFDLVVSSYTPTLGALLASGPSTCSPNCGVLAIGQKHTKGLGDLPNTVHELSTIREHTKAIGFMQLDGQNATVDAILNAMDEYSWVHLACHATQDPVHPAHSAFHLHDGNLTLEAITKRSFKGKGLAFLSACQTATGDSKLPDEALHLAAGMLMAGYPSVIATMWSIYDEDAPGVAGQVYADLFRDGKMNHLGYARALHKAVAGLRERVGEHSFERWVPFIHLGT